MGINRISVLILTLLLCSGAFAIGNIEPPQGPLKLRIVGGSPNGLPDPLAKTEVSPEFSELAPVESAAPTAEAFLAAANQNLVAAESQQLSPEKISGVLGHLFELSPTPLPSAYASRDAEPEEHQRMAQAVQWIEKSRVGSSVYGQAQPESGKRIAMRVDNDPLAGYSARLNFENNRPTLYLTQNALKEHPVPVLAAFLVRELAHLSLSKFPESAERTYMAHSLMVRSFAEMTNSRSGSWNLDADYKAGDDYLMQAYYLSWADGLKYPSILRDRPFFNFLRDERNPAQSYGNITLRAQASNGRFTVHDSQLAERQFKEFVEKESDWLERRSKERNSYP